MNMNMNLHALKYYNITYFITYFSIYHLSYLHEQFLRDSGQLDAITSRYRKFLVMSHDSKIGTARARWM